MRRNRQLLVWTIVLAIATTLAACKSAWVSSGLIYREQQGDYAKAEEMFKRALWYNDSEAVAHYELAYTLAYRAENDHLAAGEIDSARIKLEEAHYHYMRAAELDPETYKYNQDAEDEADRELSETGIASMYAKMYNEGVRYMNSDRIDEAITRFELAKLADSRGRRGFDADLLIAKLRYNQSGASGSADEAVAREVLADLESLEVDPAWEDAGEVITDLTETKANIYRGLGEDTKAAALYEELLAADPDDIRLVQSVASGKRNANPPDYAGAGDLYRRATELMRDDPEYSNEDRFAIAYQGVLAYRQGELYRECIDMTRLANDFVSNNTQRSQLVRARARAHYELEEFQLAVDEIEKVVLDGGFDPNNQEAWQIYYLALNRVGRTDDAQAARQRFVAIRDGAGR